MRALCRKEWADAYHNRRVLSLVLILPLLLVALSLLGLWGIRSVPESELLREPPPLIAVTHLDGLPVRDRFQGAIALQFLLLFLLVPVLLPVSMATHSIVGEKRERTLEPLLATPIHTGELLAGKAIAALLPSVLATLSGYALYAAVARSLIASDRVYSLVVGPIPLLAVLLLGPLLSLLGVWVALIISSRSTDPRAAEQASSSLILPLLGLFVAQLFGVVQLGVGLLLSAAVVLVALDGLLLLLAVRTFARGSILTRWG